jgi:hypothetical protein
MTPLFDLAICTAKTGRSRAIDRYAKSVMVQPSSDEALALEATCQHGSPFGGLSANTRSQE